MARRNRAVKREVLPDPVYNSTVITKLINQVMYDGKRGIATGIVYDALNIAKEKLGLEPMDIFNQAMENIKPVLETKSLASSGSVKLSVSL